MEGDEDVEEGGASMDLSAVGIVCQKKYDEMESCGSAAHFLSGAAINAGKADVMEGGGEGEKDPELELLEEGGGGDFMLDNDNTKSQCASNNHTYGSPPLDVALPQPTHGSPPDVVLPHNRKMPKRKSKFGKGATRGGDRKSSRSDTTVERHAELAVPAYATAAGDPVISDSVAAVKRLNKRQLQQRLNRSTKKLKCAERKVTSTRKKLLTTKEHCKQLARLASERRKDAQLAHLNAERKESAIRAELDHANRRINDITADVHDIIIKERASNSAQAKSKAAQAKSKAASARKRHQNELNRQAASAQKRHEKELNLQQVECDDAINQMQLTMKDNEKKALGVRKRQAAKSRAATKRHKKESNKYKRLIQRNLNDLSVSAAIIDDLGMKVTSHLRTQDELKESHKRAMAELMSSHRSKVDDLVSTHAFNLNVEKNNLRQRISSERKLQNVLYNEVLDSRQIKRHACKSVRLTKKLAAQRLQRMKEWRSRVSWDVEFFTVFALTLRVFIGLLPKLCHWKEDVDLNFIDTSNVL